MTVTGTERTSSRQASALLATTHPGHAVEGLDPSLATQAAAHLLRCPVLDTRARLTVGAGISMRVV